jgi:hypothetical protein
MLGMPRILLSDFLVQFLEENQNSQFTLTYKNLVQAIKLAVKDGELTNILPSGFYSVASGKPVRADEDRTDLRGLVQDFWILDKEAFEKWFVNGSPAGVKPFLTKNKRVVKKQINDMTDNEFEAEFRMYLEKLNATPRKRGM